MAAVEIPKMKLIKTESEGNDVSSETAEEAAPAVNVNDSISCAVREELADAVRARSDNQIAFRSDISHDRSIAIIAFIGAGDTLFIRL